MPKNSMFTGCEHKFMSYEHKFISYEYRFVCVVKENTHGNQKK